MPTDAFRFLAVFPALDHASSPRLARLVVVRILGAPESCI